MVCFETFLCFYVILLFCLENVTSCDVLKTRQLPKPEWHTLLDAHHLFKQTNKLISNGCFQEIQVLKIEEI